MAANGDTYREFPVGAANLRGVGSYHKTLPHNEFGEVEKQAFLALVAATEGDGGGFAAVPKASANSAQLTNPEAGLAADQLIRHPAGYAMPPAPAVLSLTAAAEMTELYWMALLRDVPFDAFAANADVATAAAEIDDKYRNAIGDAADAGHLITGTDAPGPAGTLAPITPQNVFRMGLPGEEVGPMVSQFFLRTVGFGTQTIDQRQRPYKKGVNYLWDYDSWLLAQNTGRDAAGQAYPQANEDVEARYEKKPRHISTMRDLARFVNKDALHQAYFNATLVLLSGGVKWTAGNPYGDGPTGTGGRLQDREAGFGVLGGPHILALVSEVATRALKVVWNQKWQVHLRLRPEAYGGLVHMQAIGLPGKGTRTYGVPGWISGTEAAKRIAACTKAHFLPMAFTPGSPTHPAYGAGHATVAGCCVTILKAYFKTFDRGPGDVVTPVPFGTLLERAEPYGMKMPISTWLPGVVPGSDGNDEGVLSPLPKADADKLTIEGELNKLAANVAMGRSVGGVHWRTDNTRSLVLGEAIAAQILADITRDVNEHPSFEFRTFRRRSDGQPKVVTISQGRIRVDGQLVDTSSSAL